MGFYNSAMEILVKDEFISHSLEERFGNVKEKMEEQISQMEQLQKEGCYLLVAGKWDGWGLKCPDGQNFSLLAVDSSMLGRWD